MEGAGGFNQQEDQITKTAVQVLNKQTQQYIKIVLEKLFTN
jgi:hypothetical protein